MAVFTVGDVCDVPTQRLFFALWPPVELQAKFYRLGGNLVGDRRGRCVRLENLHLTLAFLGSVTPELRQCFEAAADKLRAAPFTVTFTRTGCFRRNGILWAGPAVVPPALLDLVSDLNRGLSACGFEPEHRVYRAHLTLARNVRRCPEDENIAPLEWRMDGFALVESHADDSGARYEVLRQWKLAAAPEAGM
jgi:RNA 2',3'-cyclic 3'-phosphodiesterase